MGFDKANLFTLAVARSTSRETVHRRVTVIGTREVDAREYPRECSWDKVDARVGRDKGASHEGGIDRRQVKRSGKCPVGYCWTRGGFPRCQRLCALIKLNTFFVRRMNGLLSRVEVQTYKVVRFMQERERSQSTCEPKLSLDLCMQRPLFSKI